MEEEENLWWAWNPLGQVAEPLNLDDSEEEIEVDGYESGMGSEGEEREDNLDEQIAGKHLFLQYGNVGLPEVSHFQSFQHPAMSPEHFIGPHPHRTIARGT